jgi:hypothetical protein
MRYGGVEDGQHTKGVPALPALVHSASEWHRMVVQIGTPMIAGVHETPVPIEQQNEPLAQSSCPSQPMVVAV